MSDRVDAARADFEYAIQNAGISDDWMAKEEYENNIRDAADGLTDALYADLIEERDKLLKVIRVTIGGCANCATCTNYVCMTTRREALGIGDQEE